MTESFTDYIMGFKNLVFLHYDTQTINADERDILLHYLNVAKDDPTSAINRVTEYDNDLAVADSDLTPKFCK